MENQFSREEKTRYLLKKHLKENLFKYIADLIITVLFVIILLYFSKAEDFVFGIVLGIVYSLGKSIASIIAYKKSLNQEMK